MVLSTCAVSLVLCPQLLHTRGRGLPQHHAKPLPLEPSFQGRSQTRDGTESEGGVCGWVCAPVSLCERTHACVFLRACAPLCACVLRVCALVHLCVLTGSSHFPFSCPLCHSGPGCGPTWQLSGPRTLCNVQTPAQPPALVSGSPPPPDPPGTASSWSAFSFGPGASLFRCVSLTAEPRAS